MKKFLSVLGTTTLAFTLAVSPVLAAITGTASTPISANQITPYIIAGANAGGNRTCAEVGLAFHGDENYYEFSSSRVNYDDGFIETFPDGLTVTTNGTSVSFNSTFGIGAVIVKGSNSANVYEYSPQQDSDSGLASPENSSGHSAGLSNITFCWNPEEVVEAAQWCSPGYWRQEQHLDSWEATGFTPSNFYVLNFDLSTLSFKLNKNTKNLGLSQANPTLMNVLQYPQVYGGEAFNNVGDLLSEAHPDINFTGERVEDSCPLN